MSIICNPPQQLCIYGHSHRFTHMPQIMANLMTLYYPKITTVTVPTGWQYIQVQCSTSDCRERASRCCTACCEFLWYGQVSVKGLQCNKELGRWDRAVTFIANSSLC